MEQWNTKCVARDVTKTPAGQDLHLILAADVLSNKNSVVLQNIAASLKSGAFVVLEETGKVDAAILKGSGLVFVAKQLTIGKSYILLKKVEQQKQPIVIQITETNFSWVEDVKAALKKAETEDQKVLLVSQGEKLLGT